MTSCVPCLVLDHPSHRYAMDYRQQIAALPVRHNGDGSAAILLITSRKTRRWVIPKGWPIKGTSHPDSAAIEAWEEAGIKGKIVATPSALTLTKSVGGRTRLKL